MTPESRPTEQKAAHTPGPWEHRKAGKAIQGEPGHEEEFKYPDHVVSVITDDQGCRVTRFVAECLATTLPNGANARLIAAAPDLLEALKRILPAARDSKHHDFSNVNGDEDTLTEMLNAAYAAIAKATLPPEQSTPREDGTK